MVAYARGGFSGTVRFRGVIAVFEMVDTERVLEWPGITEAGGGHAEADILGKNARSDVHRERRHVGIDRHDAFPCALDVGWIIEEPLPIERHKPEV